MPATLAGETVPGHRVQLKSAPDWADKLREEQAMNKLTTICVAFVLLGRGVAGCGAASGTGTRHQGRTKAQTDSK